MKVINRGKWKPDCSRRGKPVLYSYFDQALLNVEHSRRRQVIARSVKWIAHFPSSLALDRIYVAHEAAYVSIGVQVKEPFWEYSYGITRKESGKKFILCTLEGNITMENWSQGQSVQLTIRTDVFFFHKWQFLENNFLNWIFFLYLQPEGNEFLLSEDVARWDLDDRLISSGKTFENCHGRRDRIAAVWQNYISAEKVAEWKSYPPSYYMNKYQVTYDL